MSLTLAILAAGVGSRFGADKQLQHINGSNTLFDYAIYDAINAGFDKVVLIIRTEIDPLVKSHFANRFQDKIAIEFVYQDQQVPEGIYREKPWGTGHALLCLKDTVTSPFLIINADDYYGVEAFGQMAQALKSNRPNTFYSCGYKLKNTLSENGTVSRGICEVNSQNHLIAITEATKLAKKNQTTVYDEDSDRNFNADTFVSMNFWGFTPEVFPVAEALFKTFVAYNKDNPRSEFYIPTVVQHFIEHPDYAIEVLPNNDSWFGMTYKEDLEAVKEVIGKLVAKGVYPESF